MCLYFLATGIAGVYLSFIVSLQFNRLITEMITSNNKPNGHALNIVVTGASKGIGLAIAERFAAIGANLFLCARNKEHLEASVKRIHSQFPEINVSAFPADLSIKVTAIAFAQEVLKQCPKIDILINNAGQFIPGSIFNEEEGVIETMIAVNLFSAYHLTRAILPSMMLSKAGHIFNICSIASLKAYDNGGSYSISKFALMGFSKNLREEMKPYNIKVTSVYPGAVYTASWEGSGIDKQRIMEVNDIADMVIAASQLSHQACVEEIIIRPILGDV